MVGVFAGVDFGWCAFLLWVWVGGFVAVSSRCTYVLVSYSYGVVVVVCWCFGHWLLWIC